MARAESRYVCQSCGEAFLRWEGQCRACGGWNSLVETVVRSPTRDRARQGPRHRPASTTRPPRPSTPSPRRPSRAARSGSASWTGSSAAGWSPGSVVLLGGEPGIGKSTLLLQATAGLVGDSGIGRGAVRHRRGVAVAGPPARRPPRAARRRPRRTASGSSPRTTSTGSIEAARAEPPAVLVVDSVQTAMVDDLDGARRQRRPGPRVDAPADGVREGGGDRGDPRRPRHQGRLDRRAEDPRAPRRRGPRTSRASGRRRCACCAPPRTGSGRPRRSASSRCASAACAEVADPARAFLADHDEPAPGQRRRPDARGQPAAPGRGPGARRRGRATASRPGGRAASTRTASAC